jgi:hypothetical protein
LANLERCFRIWFLMSEAILRFLGSLFKRGPTHFPRLDDVDKSFECIGQSAESKHRKKLLSRRQRDNSKNNTASEKVQCHLHFCYSRTDGKETAITCAPTLTSLFYTELILHLPSSSLPLFLLVEKLSSQQKKKNTVVLFTDEGKEETVGLACFALTGHTTSKTQSRERGSTMHFCR